MFGRPRAQPLRPRSVEAYARIDAVLEHEERPFARQLEQTLGTIRRQVLPGRVLGGSLHNNELDLVAGQDRLERLDVEAVATVRYAEHPGPGVLQGGQRAHEGRRLAHRHIARLQYRPANEVDRLTRAAGDKDLVGVNGKAVDQTAPSQLLPQRPEAIGIAIHERRRALLGEHAIAERSKLGRGM